MTRAVLLGTGAFMPPRIVTNDDMAEIYETSDEWIFSRTGIRQRHLVEKENGLTTVDMSEQAARIALKEAGLSAGQLDMIIVGTVTPDYKLPSAACVLQDRLGAKNACAFDISAACAGSLFGLSIAEKFVVSGSHKHVLVIGAETMSSILNWSDRSTAVLFGDGASAAVLGASESGSGFVAFQLYSDGTHFRDIWIKSGGSKAPLTCEGLEDKSDKVVMNGRETFKFATRALVESTQRLLKGLGLTANNVAHVTAHQANIRIVEAVAEKLGIGLDRFVINIDRYANTSSASLLATFDEGRRQGRFKPGDKVLMLAIGAGFVWGVALYEV